MSEVIEYFCPKCFNYLEPGGTCVTCLLISRRTPRNPAKLILVSNPGGCGWIRKQFESNLTPPEETVGEAQ